MTNESSQNFSHYILLMDKKRYLGNVNVMLIYFAISEVHAYFESNFDTMV